MFRTLLVDDSVVVRSLLAKALTERPDCEVAGSVTDGQAAIDWLRKRSADLVILDLEMPRADGLTVLESLKISHPDLPVLMVAGHTDRSAEKLAIASERGAIGCLEKPEADSPVEAVRQLMASLEPFLTKLAIDRQHRPQAAKRMPDQSIRNTGEPRGDTCPRILGIGSSTGGPDALRSVLAGLPSDLPVPVCSVQHLPEAFSFTFTAQLSRATSLECREARTGDSLQPGVVFVAPGGTHLDLQRSRGEEPTIRLTDADPEHFSRPSVNVLFRAMARLYGTASLGVVLTGMGSDGVEGAREIVEAGGRLIVQDEPSSVVWGMPGAVVRAGLPAEVVPLSEIADRILRCLHPSQKPVCR